MSAASSSKKQRLTMMPAPNRRLSQNRRDRIAMMFKARDDVIVVLTNTVATVSLCILGEPISQPCMRCYHNPASGRVVVYDPTQDEKVAFNSGCHCRSGRYVSPLRQRCQVEGYCHLPCH
jgi:hypothetical protein